MKGYHQFNGELALVRFSNAGFFQLRGMIRRVVKGYHQFNGELALVRFSNARLFSTERHNKKIFGKLDKTQTSWFFVSFK